MLGSRLRSVVVPITLAACLGLCAAQSASASAPASNGSLPPIETLTNTSVVEDFAGNSFTIQETNDVRTVTPDDPATPLWAYPPVAGGKSWKVRAGAPNTTIMGNLTVTEPVADGFTTIYPCAQTRPNSSVNNYTAGQTIPNFAAVTSDANGDICLFTSQTAHLIWDQVTETTLISSHNATRLMDTRTDRLGIIKAGVPRELVVGSANQTVMGNLTVVGPAGSGFTSAYPCAAGRPNTSVNNYVSGQIIPNFAAIKADANGKICFYSLVDTHLIWDQVAEGTNPAAHTAKRIFDSRPYTLPANNFVVVKVGEPNQTVMGNLTVVQPLAGGYTTAYPCNAGKPNASNNNFSTGQIIPNFAVVQADSDGNICLYSSATTALIWDQSVETSVVPAHTPLRKADTRLGDDTNYYSFLNVVNGKPSRWNPCVADIGVWVNWGNSIAQTSNVLTAISRLRESSGLPLVYRGSTTIVPTNSNKQGLDLAGAASPAQNLVFAFSDASANNLLPGGLVAGMGGFWSSSTGQILYGYVAIDQGVLAGYNNSTRIGVYMHELAHATGLGHYSDEREIMNPVMKNLTTYFANGDITGLTKVGAPAGCL